MKYSTVQYRCVSRDPHGTYFQAQVLGKVGPQAVHLKFSVRGASFWSEW